MRPAEAAVAVLTAHRTKTVDTAAVTATVAEAVAEIGVAELLEAETELASGILNGIEAVVNRILVDRNLLAQALTACAKGKPLTARDVHGDAESVLARIGTFTAGHP